MALYGQSTTQAELLTSAELHSERKELEVSGRYTINTSN